MALENLKKLIKQHLGGQSALARQLKLSPAAIAQLVNHEIYPARLDKVELQQRIVTALTEAGCEGSKLANLFKQEECCAPVATKDAAIPSTQDMESIMLLRKQTLTPDAKRTFNLFRDPFSEVRSASEVFLTPDIRYVRESMRACAKFGGFMAICGESGAGKSTLRRDLIDWAHNENEATIVIEPYVLGMEATDKKGKTLKSGHIAEAIMSAVAPSVSMRVSPEARFRQVHSALRESHRAGNRHVLIIEEAHGLPIPTLKHLKRFFELEDGFSKLLSIILIGQTELAQTLDERNPEVREIVQRCELVTLRPLDNHLEGYLSHRFKLAGAELNSVMDTKAVEALRAKLTGKGTYSVLYPLAVHNVVTAALNEAAALGMPALSADLIQAI